MPIRDELIERTVQQIAQMLARLVTDRTATQVTAQELTAAEQELDELYLANLGTRRALIHRFGTEDLLGVLRTAGSVHGERAYVLGALLSAEGEVMASSRGADDPEAERLSAAALDIMLEAGAAKVGEPDLQARIDRLTELVPQETWPAARFERLFRYAREREAYSGAENAIFAWLDRAATAQARLEVAEAADVFYGELERLEESDLRKGDFSHEEIAEGRADFAEHLADLLGGAVS